MPEAVLLKWNEMCGWLVDEVEEKSRIKKEFNRREAHNLALGEKRRLVFFPPLNKKLFTLSPTKYCRFHHAIVAAPNFY